MRTWFPAPAGNALAGNALAVLASCVLTSTALSPASAGSMTLAPNASVDQGRGDWRRHEIVRTWRDEAGCRLSVVTYHRPDGEIERRQNRECGKD
jgi:chloramphenicol 3-O-phosphotransferase